MKKATWCVTWLVSWSRLGSCPEFDYKHVSWIRLGSCPEFDSPRVLDSTIGSCSGFDSARVLDSISLDWLALNAITKDYIVEDHLHSTIDLAKTIEICSTHYNLHRSRLKASLQYDLALP